MVSGSSTRKGGARYRIGETEYAGTGFSYHDHNWGEVQMWNVMNDWYWARAQIGPYTVIVSYVTAAKSYGFEDQINFMLAKDGKLVASDQRKVTFSTANVFTDRETGKPVANQISFDFDDGQEPYHISFHREKTILSARMADQMKPLKRLLARLAGFDGAYLRFVGTAKIDRLDGERVIEHFEDPALWELMYFGKARPPAR